MKQFSVSDTPYRIAHTPTSKICGNEGVIIVEISTIGVVNVVFRGCPEVGMHAVELCSTPIKVSGRRNGKSGGIIGAGIVANGAFGRAFEPSISVA